MNNFTIGDIYSLSRIEETIDSLGEGHFISTLDSRAAYWTIQANEADRPKAAFSYRQNVFQWDRMLFGSKSTPSTCQILANLIPSLVFYRHTPCNLADVIIYSRIFYSHLCHLDETLTLVSGRLQVKHGKV